MTNKISIFLNDCLIKKYKNNYKDMNKKNEKLYTSTLIASPILAIFVFYFACNEGIINSIVSKIFFAIALCFVFAPIYAMIFMEKEKFRNNLSQLNEPNTYIPIRYYEQEKVVGRTSEYTNPEKIMFLDIDVSEITLTKNEEKTFLNLLKEFFVSDDERVRIIANFINEPTENIRYIEVYKISDYINQSIINQEKIDKIKSKL